MEYYEQQRRGLGLDLLHEVEAAAEFIRGFPAASPRHPPSGHRKIVLRRFPFALFYLEADDAIWINAVAHAKRAPGYWHERVRQH